MVCNPHETLFSDSNFLLLVELVSAVESDSADPELNLALGIIAVFSVANSDRFLPGANNFFLVCSTFKLLSLSNR